MSCGRKARGGGLPGRGRYCGHRATLRLSSLREGQARWVGTQTNGFSQASPVFIELNEGFRRQGGGRKALHLPPIWQEGSRLGRKLQRSKLRSLPEEGRGRLSCNQSSHVLTWSTKATIESSQTGNHWFQLVKEARKMMGQQFATVSTDTASNLAFTHVWFQIDERNNILTIQRSELQRCGEDDSLRTTLDTALSLLQEGPKKKLKKVNEAHFSKTLNPLSNCSSALSGGS